MFFIKIKLKGSLKNITENNEEIIDTKAIRNNNKISYNINNITHKITIYPDKILLIRDNNEFSHTIEFKKNKIVNTEYYIKELNNSIDIKIKTDNLNISDNKIEIEYEIIDSGIKYAYVIEMSDN